MHVLCGIFPPKKEGDAFKHLTMTKAGQNQLDHKTSTKYIQVYNIHMQTQVRLVTLLGGVLLLLADYLLFLTVHLKPNPGCTVKNRMGGDGGGFCLQEASPLLLDTL